MELLRELLFLVVTVTFPASCSVLSYREGNIVAELQSWGSIQIGRYNTSQWPHRLSYGSVTVSLSSIKLLQDVASETPIAQIKAPKHYDIERWKHPAYNNGDEEIAAKGRRMVAHGIGRADMNVSAMVSLFLFSGSGNLATNTPTPLPVSAGDARIELTIDVSVCHLCKRASAIELAISCKSDKNHEIQAFLDRSNKTKSGQKPHDQGYSSQEDFYVNPHHSYLLAPESATIYLDNKVRVDNRDASMSKGYPEVQLAADSSVEIIVRVPMMSSSLQYGMLVKPDRNSTTVVVASHRKQQGPNHNALQTNSVDRIQVATPVTFLLHLSCLTDIIFVPFVCKFYRLLSS